MIVFGGKTASGTLNDVWVLSNATGAGGDPAWTQLHPTGTAPAQRARHAAAYDPASNRMMVFGGVDQNNTVVSDFWVLSGANGLGDAPQWISLNQVPPSPRVHFATVYDQTNNRLVIFGGLVCYSDQSSCNLFNEVWVLRDANGLSGSPAWSQTAISGTSLPTPRFRTAAAYDSASNQMIVVGGNTSTAKTTDPVANDREVWVLSNANGLGGTPPGWSQLDPSGSPPAFHSHSVVYSAQSNRLVIYGGIAENNMLRPEVWILINANGPGGTPAWTKYATESPIPPARFSHTAIYSPPQNRMVVFGGTSSAVLNDTWVLRHADGIPSTAVSTIAIDVPYPDLCVGSTFLVTATAKDAAGNTVEGVAYEWSSDGPGVSIDPPDGVIAPTYTVVKGRDPGTPTLRARHDGVTGEKIVNVKQSATPSSLTGTWKGTGTHSFVDCIHKGSVTITLTQSGTALSGKMSLNLTKFQDGGITGVCGDTLTDSVDLTGAVNGNNLTLRIPDTTFEGSATLSGNTIDGTLSGANPDDGVILTIEFSVTKQ